jgi:DNA-binding NarL/FixJ family response regulator
VRIIVADDHPLVQEALASVLAQSLSDAEIICCLSLAEVVAAIDRCEEAVDLILLDLNMPDFEGFAGLFQLLSERPTIPVAILSAVEDSSTIRRALEYGASGYIPKSTPVARMAEAVRSILAGEIWAPHDVAKSDEADNDEAEWARRFASLSAQQIRILLLVRAGRLNKQIAADLGVAEQTVKVHVSTIFKKLHVGSRTQAAVAADRLMMPGLLSQRRTM